MTPATLTRRLMIVGAASALSGCSAISALNAAAEPLDTYDLVPAAGSRAGRTTARTLLIVRPEAPAVLASDRIMVKPDAQSVTYLGAARWSDEIPSLVQSLLIRSISATGRIGYVGRSDSGPVPDTVVLVRIDAFNIDVAATGEFDAVIDIALTALDDRDQTVRSTRSFAERARSPDTGPGAVAATFQSLVDRLFPAIADWAIQNA